MTPAHKTMCGHKDDVYPGASWRLLRLKSASSKASSTRCSFSREVLAMVPEALTSLAQQLSSSGALSSRMMGKLQRNAAGTEASPSEVQVIVATVCFLLVKRYCIYSLWPSAPRDRVAKISEYIVSNFSLPCWALLGMGLLWLIKHLQSGFPSW